MPTRRRSASANPPAAAFWGQRPAAARRYPDYVHRLHAIAAAGGYRADQLQCFLAELGDAF
jgi:hypothetical protein